ncbi:MAG: alpha/beta hydrolase family protein [Bacteroidia bacterium]
MEILRNLQLKGADNKPMLADVFFNMDGFNKPVVLFNHGFKGFKDYGAWNLVAEHFANEGFVFIKFNQSHNGTTVSRPQDFENLEAFGKNTFSRELTDIKIMLNWIGKNNALPTDLMNANDISLIGHSRGGGTALITANENTKVKRVITWAAIKNIPERHKNVSVNQWQTDGVIYTENSRTNQKMPMYYEVYEDFMANIDRFDIEKACKNLSVPQLIVHGTEDPTVIFQDALTIKSWNKDAQLYLVPNANHVFGASHPYNNNTLPSYTELAVKETISFIRNN